MVAAGLFFLAGGHWGVLQTVAWAGMLVTYTQADGSLLAGVKKTFDGEHPCRMCSSIKEAKQKERQSPAVPTIKKIEVCAAPLRCALPPRPCAEFVYPPAVPVMAGLPGNEPADLVPIGAGLV